MSKLTKKDKRRIMIWSLLIVIVISYLAVFSYNCWSDILSNRKQTKELEDSYTALLKEEEELNSAITKLQDPNYVAKSAREKFMLSKDGEIILKFKDN